jgi:hypothetical protein
MYVLFSVGSIIKPVMFFLPLCFGVINGFTASGSGFGTEKGKDFLSSNKIE